MTNGPTTLVPTLEELRSLVSGRVLLPGDADWEAARRGWNVHVDQRPAAVVEVDGPAEIAAVLRCAAALGLAVTAQPVGHGAATSLDGAVILRTTGMRALAVDVERGTARVGAGVRARELNAALDGTGLAALTGSSGDPTVVGYTLGGGLPWFGRAYGFAANSVLSFELVDPAGNEVMVTAESDPDLFWALRGGGGDFGIVTAMEIRLHPAEHIYGGRLLWPAEMAREVLLAYSALTSSAPPELSLWAWLFNFPPIPDIPEPLRGGSFVAVDATFLGDAQSAEDFLRPLREAAPVVFDTMGTVPVSALGDIAMEPVDPLPAVEFSTLLNGFGEDAIDDLLSVAGPGTDSPLLLVEIRHLGGALAQPRAEQGVVGSTAEPFILFSVGVPMAPGLEAAIRHRFGRLGDAMGAHSSGRTLFNWLGEDPHPGRAFRRDDLRRLQDIKRERDPQGTLHSNRPVLGTVLTVPTQR